MTPQDFTVLLPALIGAIIFGLKRTLPATFYQKVRNYVPLFAIVLGIVVSIVYSYSFDLSNSQKFTTILQGIVIGAAAVGYRETVKRMINPQE